MTDTTSDMKDVDIAEVLKHTERSNTWIREHYQELKANHEGEVFAVRDEKLVATNKNVVALMEDVKKKGEDPLFLVVGSVPRKGVTFIL